MFRKLSLALVVVAFIAAFVTAGFSMYFYQEPDYVYRYLDIHCPESLENDYWTEFWTIHPWDMGCDAYTRYRVVEGDILIEIMYDEELEKTCNCSCGNGDCKNA